MPLVLTNQDQERAFVVAGAIEAMASGLRQLAHGDATRRPRIDNYCPTGRPGEFLNFSSMEGVVRDPGYYALRIKPDVMSWPLVDGIRRKHTFNTRPGRWGGLVFLFRVQTGELLAILNDGFVQHARVAATAALGIRYLARAGRALPGHHRLGRHGAQLRRGRRGRPPAGDDPRVQPQPGAPGSLPRRDGRPAPLRRRGRGERA